MRTSGLLIVLFLSIFDIHLYSQAISSELVKGYKETAQKITDSALVNRNAYSMLKKLCNIGPRLSGSENSITAIHWAENKMKELGFDNVHLQPVIVPHWVRGNVEKAVIVNGRYKDREINICALGGSIGTEIDGITAPVIEVKSLNEIDSVKQKVKGKIVFINESMDETLLSTFAAYGKAAGKRIFGAIKAARYGAVAVIIRSITTRFDNVPHTGVMIYNDTIPKIPGVAAGYMDSDFLSKALKDSPDLKINLKLILKSMFGR